MKPVKKNNLEKQIRIKRRINNLIDVSDDENEIIDYLDRQKETIKISEEIEDVKIDIEKNNEQEDEIEEIINNIGKNEIILIQKENIDSSDLKIMDFIKFCLKKRLFDDTFYDYGNAFSVMATKLPITFEKLTKDGKIIEKSTFINIFKNEFNYRGDIEYIFNNIKHKETNIITWEEFSNFFLPFVKYITY